ncbi:MAG TPA: hypothetical protein VK112_01490 [Fodinibius sp.]|nr:hypothetical protein [Fodinibius sp.]
MIETQRLTEAELHELRNEARTSFMALPFLMTIATILAWLFNFYWFSFLIMTIIVSAIFLFAYLNKGKENIDYDIKEGVKLLRMGKIVDATMQTGIQTRLKTVDITLEKEPIPDPYPEIHIFGSYIINRITACPTT